MKRSTSLSQRVLIVGGVAGGASCAARLRRLDERAEIVVFDRGPYVSFANCGLPYYIGEKITDEKKLLVADAELFRRRFNIMVHLNTEVLAIDRTEKTIEVRDLTHGTTRTERYDELVLAPGATPLRPPLPGIDLPGIFTLRTVPDSRAIRQWITERRVRRAIVVGGGFIGLEMAENLTHRGLQVTVIEKLDQVMPPLDAEMAACVADHLRRQNVRLALSEGVTGFEAIPGGLRVTTERGIHEGELVILAIGVRPETTLATAAGLKLGPRGGLRVDERMQTSDPDIHAVGDAVEVCDWVGGAPALVPLAGPANRQGRIAAEAIAGRASSFRGVQGTAICGLFGLQVASTGSSERRLQQAGADDYEKIYLQAGHHAGYYPGAQTMLLKLIFRKSDGEILGAQAVGGEGVDRRIDIIAMALQKHGTVYDLEEAELCYAPQFGSARDPVNLGGMIAANVLHGEMPVVHWTTAATGETLFLDVRDGGEWEKERVPGALHIPLDTLRFRLGELASFTDIRVYCESGQRGYLATRILNQAGLPARNLSGGLVVRRLLSGPSPG
ncbi:MAG TPA: FAD-dependent oxidoreductase [Chthoniobacteraceae bacterium]|nr:FAD-dependent oxidoreductase [Chthoniobacteraceae bacterium]